MGLLTKEQIVQANDLPKETVEVPEWGGSVIVRGLTGAERDQLETSMISIQGSGKNAQVRMKNVNLRATLVAMSVVDEAGKRLFSDDDVKMLGQKSASALERVSSVAQKLSGLSDSDMEDLEKNSGSDQSGVGG